MTASPTPPIPPHAGGTPAPGSSPFKQIDPLRILRRYTRLLIATVMLGVVIGFATWGLLRTLMPRYTSEAQLQATFPLVEAWDLAGGGEMVTGRSMEIMEAFIQNEIVRLKSEEVLNDALDTPEVQETDWYKSFNDKQEAREALEERYLKVTPIRGSTLIYLKVGSPWEDDPPKILESIIRVYLKKLEVEAQQASGDVRLIFGQERDRIEDDLRQLQDKINEFTRTEKLTTVESRYSEAAVVYGELAKQNVLFLLAMDQAREVLAGLQGMYAAGPSDPSAEALALVEMMPDILRMKYQIDQLSQEVASYGQRNGVNHYWTRRLQTDLEAVIAEKQRVTDKRLRERQQMMLEIANKNVAGMEGQMEALQPRIEEAQKRLTDLTARLNLYQEMFDQLEALKEKRQQADESLTAIRVSSVRPEAVRVRRQVSSTIPELTFPRIPIIVPMVTILILGLVTGVIFLYELLDQRIKTPVDITLLPAAELLGVLPDAGEDPSGPSGVERVVEKYPSGLMAEAFRQTRTAILAKMDRRGYKTLLVVGAQPGCGSSSITHNLATSLAYSGRNVLIVDANFRRPSQHRHLGLGNEKGLVDVLRLGTPVSGLLQQLDGFSVSLLPTGQSADAPPELIEGARFRAMMGQLETDFDLVIVDAPPALLASDSQLLAKLMDAVVIVVRAGSDKRGMIDRMVRQFDGQRADVLGIILNGVQTSAGGYFRQSYREFYRYRDNGASTSSEDAAEQERSAMSGADAS